MIKFCSLVQVDPLVTRIRPWLPNLAPWYLDSRLAGAFEVIRVVKVGLVIGVVEVMRVWLSL